MDYTKFLSDGSKFKLRVDNEYIKEAIETLKDIKKSEYILSNHHRFTYKIELDEYFAYFLREKNSFIKSFQVYIIDLEKEPDISYDKIKILKEILALLRSNLDNLITNFKILKQNIFKKAKQQERFNEQKYTFFMNQESFANTLKKKAKEKVNQIIQNIPLDFDKVGEEIKNRYKESNNIIKIFLDKEKINFEKTKRILYDLSDLMSTVTKKMHEQSEMTKNILFNSLSSLKNIDEGNKHLEKAKEYQKGRGFMIGIIFVILGLFLILYDR